MLADILYDIEQIPAGWLIAIGAFLLVGGVWMLASWAKEDDRKRRERRRGR